MSRWWGPGRRKARAAARRETIRRQRELVDLALDAARAHPPTHPQRWRSLEPVAAVSDDAIAEVALPMLRSADGAEVVLGLQLLDPAVFDGQVGLPRQTELAVLLERLVRPDGDPDVIAAALGVWSAGNRSAAGRLDEFLAHPSPTVRARAATLHALDTSTPAHDRLVGHLDRHATASGVSGAAPRRRPG